MVVSFVSFLKAKEQMIENQLQKPSNAANPDIVYPQIGSPVFQVHEVVLFRIGFSLKRDRPVGQRF
jgi:hypothetical protein